MIAPAFPTHGGLSKAHTMLIGQPTGGGSQNHSTALAGQSRSARARPLTRVIYRSDRGFRLKRFYNPETDTILNPMDQRCVPWTIFNDCELYADFLYCRDRSDPVRTPDEKEPFWQTRHARCFVEICMKLKADGRDARTPRIGPSTPDDGQPEADPWRV